MIIYCYYILLLYIVIIYCYYILLLYIVIYFYIFLYTRYCYIIINPVLFFFFVILDSYRLDDPSDSENGVYPR